MRFSHLHCHRFTVAQWNVGPVHRYVILSPLPVTFTEHIFALRLVGLLCGRSGYRQLATKSLMTVIFFYTEQLGYRGNIYWTITLHNPRLQNISLCSCQWINRTTTTILMMCLILRGLHYNAVMMGYCPSLVGATEHQSSIGFHYALHANPSRISATVRRNRKGQSTAALVTTTTATLADTRTIGVAQTLNKDISVAQVR